MSHGRWLYAGDGDSTLKVIDLDAPNASAIKQSISTGGTTRVDEMALTTDGELLLTANNAEDPPFANLFMANGDRRFSNVRIITQIFIDKTIVPEGVGLAMEQPAWDPKTERFYVSVPIIANNPKGCNYDAGAGPITCDGGLAVIDPMTVPGPNAVLGAVRPGHQHRGRAAALRAARTAPPSDHMTICCWAALRPTTRAMRPRS